MTSVDQYNETPLHRAARKGHSAVAEVLLSKGRTVLIKSEEAVSLVRWLGVVSHEGYQAIHLAAMNGHVGVLKLFSVHISIDITTSHRETPLMLAAARGHVSAIEWLVANGASLTSQTSDSEGGIPMDALKIAASCGHEEAAWTLFDYMQQKHIYHILSGSYLIELLVLAATNRHMNVLATLIERIRSISHKQDPHGRELLLTQLEDAGWLASMRKLQDAAQLLQHLAASIRREREQDVSTSSG